LALLLAAPALPAQTAPPQRQAYWMRLLERRVGEAPAQRRHGAAHLFPKAATPPRALPLPLWVADDLPFFCKIEHRWAKKLPMPLKFRLGSVEYVDWLEGK
jgi:hypothetical protein